MFNNSFTYDIVLPDGTTKEWLSPYGDKPYLVLELRKTGNFVYRQWQFKTPTGASQQMRKLLARKEEDAKNIPSFNMDESSFVLASPKEMD